MSEFTFRCPQCRQSVEADESCRGQIVECPFCGKGIVVPRTKLPSASECKDQLSGTSPELNSAHAPTPRHVKSPKLHRIRQESATDSFVGVHATPSTHNQTNDNTPSSVPLRHQPSTIDNDEQSAERNNTGLILNILLAVCIIGGLVVGGGVFVVSHCDKKYTALKNLIEQTKYQPDEKVSQMSDRVREMRENLAALSGCLQTISKRVTGIEEDQKQYNENLTNQNRKQEEKCASLLERIESLSRQVAENSSSVRHLERHTPSVVLPEQPHVSKHPQVIVQNEPAAPDALPEESLDDLQQKLNHNLAEIKELVKKNPACYINPKAATIINRENKIATMKDRRYCACVNVTFVRDAFYCSGCKQVTPYRADVDYNDYGRCKVCRQMSFYRWLEARKKVDETATSNARIDDLYIENESLEKQIRSLKQSRRRR